MSARQKLVIVQGKTFKRVVRWETMPYLYVPIASITKTAPVAITTTVPHNLPDAWRAAVVSAKGMHEINAEHDPPKQYEYNRITVVSATQIEINSLNAADFHDYISGGYLQAYTPASLDGFLARMTIKDRIGGTVLAELNDTNGRTYVSDTAKTITLQISAVDTAAFDWCRGVYDLELEGPTGEVFGLLQGEVELTREVTT